MSWGAVKGLKNGSKIGSIIALTYRNSQNIQYNERQDYQTADKTDITADNLFFKYNDTTYSFSTSVGVLANFGYKKGNTKIVFKNLLNQLFENNNLHRGGINYDNLQVISSTGSVAVSKSLISSQLEGEHKLSDRNDRLRWNVNYGLTLRDQPDYRVLPYAKSLTDVDNKDVSMRVVLRDTYRFWSDLTEHAVGGNVNYSVPVTIGGDKSTLKAGLFAQNKYRDFSTRIFRYEAASPNTSEAIYSYPPDKVFNDGNMVRNGFVLNEITNNTDKYDATSGLYAGYAMIDARVFDKLRAVVGARVESFNFVVNTSDFSNADVKVVGKSAIRGRGTCIPDLLAAAERDMPPGFFSLEALERYLKQAYASRGLANSFAERERTLLIPAIDLDTAERVVFGAGSLRDVPISQAVAASSAIPGFFDPYSISGRDYVDGGVGFSGHADLAAEAGAQVVFVVNPLVPNLHDGTVSMRARGVYTIMEQAGRIYSQNLLNLGLSVLSVKYPQTSFFLLQPPRTSSLLFGPSMGFEASRKALRFGYESTMNWLVEQGAALLRRLTLAVA
jgi:hypothetical protein